MISVIIPAFNASRFIAEAIESVLVQQAGTVEIIVIDDGSTDDTRAVADSFPSVRCLSKPQGGTASARNTGIDVARGELLAFLDADDVWAPGKLQRQYAMLHEHPELEAVFGQVQQFFVNPATGERVIASPQEGHTPSTMLIRTPALLRVGKYNVGLPLAEALDWYLRAQAAQLKIAVLPDVVLFRRIHGENAGILHRAPQMRQYFQVLRNGLRQKKDQAKG